MKISVIGSGSYGTAIASILASHDKHEVTVYTRSQSQADDINKRHQNTRYLDNYHLAPRLCCSLDLAEAFESEFLFLALPSGALKGFIDENKALLSSSRFLINLAKGFISKETQTIPEYLQQTLGRSEGVGALKGPTFAADMLLAPISAVTIAASDENCQGALRGLLSRANIVYDEISDISSIEYLSILKNIYAIAIGIIEARFNNPNVRAALVTQAAIEMQRVCSLCVGRDVDIFKYAGLGDLLLTSLNDQSRNRTLGLMIGKGFISADSYDKGVVVEGLKSIGFIVSRMSEESLQKNRMLAALNNLVNAKINVAEFVSLVLHQRESRTVA